jgi:membrane protein DedA with SNARE-associated domain
MKQGEKTKFFLKNLLRGFAWLAVLVFTFIFIRKNVDISFISWLEPVFENTALIYLIYSVSELVFGIIPPELFMFWAMRSGMLADYVFHVFFLALISYFAGIAGYLFGSYLETTVLFRYIRRRFLGKYHSMLQKYGYYLILVAALTPIPFSGISMLVGSLHYPLKKYLWWASSRFLRYVVYAVIIWETGYLMQ